MLSDEELHKLYQKPTSELSKTEAKLLYYHYTEVRDKTITDVREAVRAYWQDTLDKYWTIYMGKA
jgi:hypothetical protein